MSKEEKQIKRLQKRIMKLFLRTQALKGIAEDAIRESQTIKDENQKLHEYVRRINEEL